MYKIKLFLAKQDHWVPGFEILVDFYGEIMREVDWSPYDKGYQKFYEKREFSITQKPILQIWQKYAQKTQSSDSVT